MKVARVDLLERHLGEDGRCIGKARVCLESGDHVIVDCDFEYTGTGQAHLNGAFAFEAVRQIKRMPQYTASALNIAENAMPLAGDHRL